MMLETRQLHYFAMVAEERHFGRAAERLRLAQPYLSQQIRKLERQLGTTLLNRTTRTVSLTSAGAHLLDQARQVLAQLDAVSTEVQLIGEGLQGPLRLGFTGSTTYGVMPQVVRRTAAAAPRLQLNVSGEMITPRLIARLLDGSLDIAVLRDGAPVPGLRREVLGSEPCVLAVPMDAPLAGRDIVTHDDLTEHALVGYPRNSVMSAVTEEFFTTRVGDGPGDRPVAAPKYAVRASETSTLMSLVAAGLGAAVVPSTAMALGLPDVGFRPLHPAPRTDLALAWRTQDETPAITRMARIITEVVTGVLDTGTDPKAKLP